MPLLHGVRQKRHLYWQHEPEMTLTLRSSAWSKGGTGELSHFWVAGQIMRVGPFSKQKIGVAHGKEYGFPGRESADLQVP